MFLIHRKTMQGQDLKDLKYTIGKPMTEAEFKAMRAAQTGNIQTQKMTLTPEMIQQMSDPRQRLHMKLNQAKAGRQTNQTKNYLKNKYESQPSGSGSNSHGVPDV